MSKNVSLSSLRGHKSAIKSNSRNTTTITYRVTVLEVTVNIIATKVVAKFKTWEYLLWMKGKKLQIYDRFKKSELPFNTRALMMI